MKFVATEDIAASSDHVWRVLTDADRSERRLAKRVGRIERVPPGPAGPGTYWTADAEIIGKVRRIKVTLDRMDGPSQLAALAMVAETDGMRVTILAELEALGPARTRLTVTTDAKARSMAARVMLQSAKLARQRLATRYKERIADFADRVEASFQSAA